MSELGSLSVSVAILDVNLGHPTATFDEQAMGVLQSAWADVKARLEVATELETLFELRWQADMRAVERWRAEAPGRELTLPDRADMVVWALNRFDVAVSALVAAEKAIENCHGYVSHQHGEALAQVKVALETLGRPQEPLPLP